MPPSTPKTAQLMIVSSRCPFDNLRGEHVWVYKDEYRKIKTVKDEKDYFVHINAT